LNYGTNNTCVKGLPQQQAQI